jgi:hypothetical protein
MHQVRMGLSLLRLVLCNACLNSRPWQTVSIRFAMTLTMRKPKPVSSLPPTVGWRAAPRLMHLPESIQRDRPKNSQGEYEMRRLTVHSSKGRSKRGYRIPLLDTFCLSTKRRVMNSIVTTRIEAKQYIFHENDDTFQQTPVATVHHALKRRDQASCPTSSCSQCQFMS